MLITVQTKAIKAQVSKLTAVNLASQHVRPSTNASRLKMAEAILLFAKGRQLEAKPGINGCLDLELSVTFNGLTRGTTAGGIIKMLKDKLDAFVQQDRVHLSFRTSVSDMNDTAIAVLEFALDAGVYSQNPRKKDDDDFLAPLVIALNSLGLSCGNKFRPYILEPIYHGALSTNRFIGLNLFRWCGMHAHDIGFFYPTPGAAEGAAAHTVRFSLPLPSPSPNHSRRCPRGNTTTN